MRATVRHSCRRSQSSISECGNGRIDPKRRSVHSSHHLSNATLMNLYSAISPVIRSQAGGDRGISQPSVRRSRPKRGGSERPALFCLCSPALRFLMKTARGGGKGIYHGLKGREAGLRESRSGAPTERTSSKRRQTFEDRHPSLNDRTREPTTYKACPILLPTNDHERTTRLLTQQRASMFSPLFQLARKLEVPGKSDSYVRHLSYMFAHSHAGLSCSRPSFPLALLQEGGTYIGQQR